MNGKKCGENLRQLASVSKICDEDCRLQNSPYFCVFNSREQSKNRFGTRLKTETMRALRAGDAHKLRARKTLTPRFTDFFTDFEEKKRVFCSVLRSLQFIQFYPSL